MIGGRTEHIDDNWASVEAEIALDAAQFKPDATAGLSDFSHIEVVFHFNKVPDADIQTGARHLFTPPPPPRKVVF